MILWALCPKQLLPERQHKKEYFYRVGHFFLNGKGLSLKGNTARTINKS
jgi:hypothetical protein